MNTQPFSLSNASQVSTAKNPSSGNELGWNAMTSFTNAELVTPIEAELGWDAMGAWGSQLPKSRANEIIAAFAPEAAPVGERRLLASFWLSMGVRSMQG
jgi:hypothetical protein